MSLLVNGTSIENVKVNVTNIEKVVYDGTTVWEAWKYTTGSIKVANKGTQGGSNDYSMQGKKPVKVHNRWWWAGSGSGPTGYVKFTFHYADGTILTWNTSTSERDTDTVDTLPSEYQKELNYFDWELITNVGTGVVRTCDENSPGFEAWYQK